MELEKIPFSADSFASYKRYREAVDEFHTKLYRGKRVEFAHELIGESGSVMHKKGRRVKIIDVDCGMIRVRDSYGVPIRSLFKPQAFNLIEP